MFLEHDLDAVGAEGGLQGAGGQVGAGAGLGHQQEGQAEVQGGEPVQQQVLACPLELGLTAR